MRRGSKIQTAMKALVVFAMLVVETSSALAAEVRVALPLGRTAYQTNEAVELAVIRSSDQPLAGGDLVLTLTGGDGSALGFRFPAAAASVVEGKALATEHLRVAGQSLRPGGYEATVAVDGVTASATFDLFSHVRRSPEKLINWGRTAGAAQRVLGEDSLGFNHFYGVSGGTPDNFIRAGVDIMGVCVMSGGHQMDLRMECDWSDPRVSRGGTMRVVNKAFQDRTLPNVPGVNFYDEPGLTWFKDEETGVATPHGVPSQVRAYELAFGRRPQKYHKVDPANAESASAWKHWTTWKLGFMDAAWRDAQFGVSYVRPDYLSATQSQYGWSAPVDGYYFNVTRSLPVISGHGGYHDWGLGYFNPVFFLDMARARDHARPNWYLPTWYHNTTNDEFRVQQYTSFIINMQGMMSPPDLEPTTNPSARDAIVETNLVMGRLGTVFAPASAGGAGTPVTRPPVAILYSISDFTDAHTKDRSLNYSHATRHGASIPIVYLAGQRLQQRFLAVVDEDVVDGTLAASHKAVVLASIQYLAPEVVAGLEDFASAGGLVLKTSDTPVQIKGAIDLGVAPALPDKAAMDALLAEFKKTGKNEWGKLEPFQSVAKFAQAADVVAKAIKPHLEKAGIRPVIESDEPGIAASLQDSGEIEYLFAVNAAPDAEAGKRNSMKPVKATLGVAGPGVLYDAVRGGPVAEFGAGGKKQGESWRSSFRFGVGQLRAFARCARAIGGVRVTPAMVHVDSTLADAPITIRFSAALLDDKGGLLAGAAPLRIVVTDPLGQPRFDLLRATAQGVASVTLPLAANDAPGEWRIAVEELLSNTRAESTFTYRPATRAGFVAGRVARAVMLGGEEGNLFRFARVHHEATIVAADKPAYADAVARTKEVLEHWGVKCKVMPVAEAAKARLLTEEEASTWVGLAFAGKGQIKPGDGNAPQFAGFAVQGPVVLIGTPEDHPIIKFIADQKFLPYAAKAGEFPGRGRGYIAWQRDAVGRGQESITLIAHDASGLAEATGSLYEAVAGMSPLTRWELPVSNTISPAKKAGMPAEAPIAWRSVLPDQVVAFKADGAGVRALTHDQSTSVVSADGKVSDFKPLGREEFANAVKEWSAPVNPADLKPFELPDRMVKLIAKAEGRTAIVYWGGTLRVVDAQGAEQTRQRLPYDITAAAWSGNRLIVGLTSGEVIGFGK